MPKKPDATPFARALRRQMTPAECRLWYLLRNRATGHRFRRQEPRGPYTLDFVCLPQRLVIELDGEHHAESETDPIRDAWLAARGFRVLRFQNWEVMREVDGVWATIARVLDDREAVVERVEFRQGPVRRRPR